MDRLIERVPFAIGLTHPVLGITRRSGWLLRGECGWSEWSPLPSWSRADAIRAYRGAVDAASAPFPDAVQDMVIVNSMIPRVAPGEAARMAAASPCATVKVKVGDADSEDRVRAVRSAIGPSRRIRLDANGAWNMATAARVLVRLASLDIELVEDPVPGLAGLAALRRAVPMPLAAEMAIRTLADVDRRRLHEAADALVVKPQRIGGVTNALRAAAMVDIPVIISSALESSVGLSAVLAAAAALPRGPFAHGVGTAMLLSEDVTTAPLFPSGGVLRPRRVAPDRLSPAGLR
jgi:O-succinylbenzoate synthase